MCMDPSCLSNLFEKASHTVPNPRIRGDVLLGPFHFMRHSFNLTPHFIFHLKKIYYAQAMIQTQAAGVWAECLFCMLLWDKRGVKALWRDTEVELLLLAGCSFTNSCCYQDVHSHIPVVIRMFSDKLLLALCGPERNALCHDYSCCICAFWPDISVFSKWVLSYALSGTTNTLQLLFSCGEMHWFSYY